MAQATASTADVRRIFMELRTGDVLEVGGVRIQLQYKKGQTARMVVAAGSDTRVKKIPAVTTQLVPSLTS